MNGLMEVLGLFEILLMGGYVFFLYFLDPLVKPLLPACYMLYPLAPATYLLFLPPIPPSLQISTSLPIGVYWCF